MLPFVIEFPFSAVIVTGTTLGGMVWTSLTFLDMFAKDLRFVLTFSLVLSFSSFASAFSF